MRLTACSGRRPTSAMMTWSSGHPATGLADPQGPERPPGGCTRRWQNAGLDPAPIAFHDLRHTFSTPTWRRQACPCGRCRSGWGTSTSRRPTRYADYARRDDEVAMLNRAFTPAR